MEKIIPGKHVTLVYDLYTVDNNGNEELVHQSDEKSPEEIIFGVTQGVIVPLEKALDGLQKGDSYNVTAKPEEAFGPHVPEQIVSVDKDIFIVDGKFHDQLVKVGNYVPLLTADGYQVSGKVLEIGEDKVTLDFNHPLAGKTVRFKGKVLEVREPTEEELHIATNPGCGCGCGCNQESDCGENCNDGCGCHGCH